LRDFNEIKSVGTWIDPFRWRPERDNRDLVVNTRARYPAYTGDNTNIISYKDICQVTSMAQCMLSCWLIQSFLFKPGTGVV
jgi:hypothetical protein